MPSYTEKPPTSRRSIARSRPFISAVYKRVAGRQQPELPASCPSALDEPDGRPCANGFSYFRARRTGPTCPLAVCRCATHGVAFTVYPWEFAPYLRQPLVTLETSQRTRSDGPLGDFAGTVFDAALAAASGEAWSREGDPAAPGTVDRWWSTQGRKLGEATRLLGVAIDMADEVRLRIAERLDVPVTRLIELSRDTTGYRSRGEAVVAVLRQLRRSPSLAWRLATCAWLVGRLGRPIRASGHGVLQEPPLTRPAMPSGP